MIGGTPELSSTTAAFVVVAAGMIAFNLVVLLQFFPRKGRRTPTLSRAAIVGYVLVSSWFLWITILYDALTGDSQLGATALLFGVQIMMMAPFVWCFVTILRGHQYHVDPTGYAWPAFLALVILGNELFMGSVYAVIVLGNGGFYPGGTWGLGQAFAVSVVSVWFFWSMFANTMVLLFWVPMPRAERVALVGLAATALIGPWVLADAAAAGVLMAVVMAATLLLTLVEIRRSPGESTGAARVLQGVALGFTAMAAGVLLAVARPGAAWAPLPFAGTMVLVMAGEMLFLARRVLGILSAGAPTGSKRAAPSPAVPASN